MWQRNVASQLIILWLTATFNVFDHVIGNRRKPADYVIEFTEFMDPCSNVAGIIIK